MEWRKYSLPHVMYDQYCSNTKKGYNGNRFGGDSYFLAHLSDHEDIATAVNIMSLLLSIPFYFMGFFYGLFSLVGIHFVIASVLSILDTYSTRKFRVRINFKKSIEWIYNKDPKKRRGWY